MHPLAHPIAYNYSNGIVMYMYVMYHIRSSFWPPDGPALCDMRANVKLAHAQRANVQAASRHIRILLSYIYVLTETLARGLGKVTLLRATWDITCAVVGYNLNRAAPKQP